jgi:uncharacterized protein YcfL
MKRIVMLMAGVCVGAGMLGCRTPSAGIVVESYPKTKISVNSKVVGRYLDVVEYVATNRNGLLQAQVTVMNRTREDVQFEHRFRWLTGVGVEIHSGMSTWIPVNISSKEKMMLNAIAPNGEAEDFVWDIRFVRPSTRW